MTSPSTLAQPFFQASDIPRATRLVDAAALPAHDHDKPIAGEPTASSAGGVGDPPSWRRIRLRPSVREGASYNYDSASDRMILFGGQDILPGGQPSARKNDVWVLVNTSGRFGTPQWFELTPAPGNQPLPRRDHSAVYDGAGNRLVIFGGNDGAPRADVWVLTHSNGLGGMPQWTNTVKHGSPGPNPTTGALAAYTAAANRMVVTPASPGGTWLLSNANGLGGPSAWTKLDNLSASYGASAVYDDDSDRMIIFGGGTGSSSTNQLRLLLNASGVGPASWMYPSPTGALPPARAYAGSSYDRANDRMILFGGSRLSTNYNGVWVLLNASSVSGPPSWVNTVPDNQPGAPWAPRFPGLGYHAAANLLVVCIEGNYGINYPSWGLTHANGIGGPSAWSQTLIFPGGGNLGSLVYRRVSDDLMLFAGRTIGPPDDNGTWILRNATGRAGPPAWTNPLATGVAGSPRTRQNFGTIYDESGDRMTIFGGLIPGSALNDTWILINASGSAGPPAWTQALADGAPGNPPRRGHISPVYNSALDLMVLFGGSTANIGSGMADTWYLENATARSGAPKWRSVPIPSPPPARGGYAAGLDAASDNMVIFGGGEGCCYNYKNDVWVLENATSSGGSPKWVPQSPAGTPPSPRLEPAHGYHLAQNALVVMGGYSSGPGFPVGVWRLGGANGVGTPVWANTMASQAAFPEPRDSVGFDEVEGGLIGFDRNFPTLDNILVLESAANLNTPSQPTSPQLTGQPGQIRFNWSAPALDGGQPVAGYRVYRANSSDPFLPIADLGPQLDFIDASVADFQNYRYRVSAKNLVGEGTASEERSGSTLSPPGPPQSPEARGARSRVRLSWDPPAATGASVITGYNIYRSLNPGPGSLVASIGNVKQFVDLNVTPATTYYYEVAGTTTQGEGPHSAAVNATPAPSDWVLAVPAADGTPPVRRGHSVAYDQTSNRLVLFGGEDGARRNDAWVLARANGLGGRPAWTNLIGDGAPGSPSGRSGAAAGYHPATNRLVIFGGDDGQFRNDVWVLTGANGLAGPATWTNVLPDSSPGSPSQRKWMASAYDAPGDRLIVMGGWDGVLRNDVWVLENATETGGPAKWSQTIPHGSAGAPTPRREHAAAYDPFTNRLMLFGGWDGSLRGDTWILTSANGSSGPRYWRNIVPEGLVPAPMPRRSHTIVYDEKANRLVLFGGWNSTDLRDAWVLSTANGVEGLSLWSPVSEPELADPPQLSSHGAAFDPATNRMVVFGGGSGAPSGDTWVLGTANGLGADPAWVNLLAPGTPTTLLSRHYTASAYDEATGRLIVFGGFAGSYRNDVWVLDHADGTGGRPQRYDLVPHDPTRGPLPRLGASAVFDPVSGSLTIYGGSQFPLTELGDVWVLSNASGAGVSVWTEITPAGPGGPGPRAHHSAVYDLASNRMIVFGGTNYTGRRSDVWALTHANGIGGAPTWVQLVAEGAPGSPAPRYAHTSVLDPASNRMVMFGGYAGAYYNDVWVLRNASGIGGTPTWTNALPNGAGGSPAGRSGHSAGLDLTNGRMVVFGGGRNDVWVLKNASAVDGTQFWTNLVPQGAPGAPLSRTGAAGGYDQLDNRLVVFGGQAGSYVELDDLWVLKEANGMGSPPVWTNLFPFGGGAPEGRMQHSMVYDPATDRVILHGGNTPFGGPRGDVWLLLNASGSSGRPEWRLLVRHGDLGLTGGTKQHSAIYGMARNRMVVFGGVSSSDYWTSVRVLNNANGVGGAPSWYVKPYLSGYEPQPSVTAAAVYTPGGDAMIVFGGDMKYGGARSSIEKLWWATQLMGVMWTNSYPTGITEGMHSASSPSVGYDELENRMVVFGGDASNNEVNILVFANSSVGYPYWNEAIRNGQSGSPVPRTLQSGFLDVAENRFIVFGGQQIPSTYFLGDTWVLENALDQSGGQRWTETSRLPVTPGPSVRGAHAAVLLEDANRLLVHGGTGPGGHLDDLWWLTEADEVGAVPPSKPLGLMATKLPDRVELTWTPPAYNGGRAVTGYLIFRGTAPGGESFLVEVGDVLNYTDTLVVPGDTYYYHVSARNKIGRGNPSDEVTSVIVPMEPSLAAAAAVIAAGVAVIHRYGRIVPARARECERPAERSRKGSWGFR